MAAAQKSIRTQNKTEQKTDSGNLVNLWLEWQVVKDQEDPESLISLDFKLINKEMAACESQKVSVPIVALFHLAEKYNWLQVLRNADHRPSDPYELVRFIQMLDRL